MDWTQVMTIIVANIAFGLTMFLWLRAESRADIRHADNKIDAIRELTYAIHLEMKDFHGRLVAIEEKKK